MNKNEILDKIDQCLSLAVAATATTAEAPGMEEKHALTLSLVIKEILTAKELVTKLAA